MAPGGKHDRRDGRVHATLLQRTGGMNAVLTVLGHGATEHFLFLAVL